MKIRYLYALLLLSAMVFGASLHAMDLEVKDVKAPSDVKDVVLVDEAPVDEKYEQPSNEETAMSDKIQAIKRSEEATPDDDKIFMPLFREAFANGYKQILHDIFSRMTSAGKNAILDEMLSKPGFVDRFFSYIFCTNCAGLDAINRVVRFVESQENGPARMRRLLLSRPYGQPFIFSVSGSKEALTLFISLAEKYLGDASKFLNQRDQSGASIIPSFTQRSKWSPQDEDETPDEKLEREQKFEAELKFILAQFIQRGLEIESSLLPAIRTGGTQGIKILADAILSKENGRATLARLLLPDDQKKPILYDLVKPQQDQRDEQGPEVLMLVIDLAKGCMDQNNLHRFLNQKGPGGRTALMAAVQNRTDLKSAAEKKRDHARVLLKQEGIDTAVTDDDGKTARELNPEFYDECVEDIRKRKDLAQRKHLARETPYGEFARGRIADLIGQYSGEIADEDKEPRETVGVQEIEDASSEADAGKGGAAASAPASAGDTDMMSEVD